MKTLQYFIRALALSGVLLLSFSTLPAYAYYHVSTHYTHCGVGGCVTHTFSKTCAGGYCHWQRHTF